MDSERLPVTIRIDASQPIGEMRPVWHAFGVLPATDTGSDDIHSAEATFLEFLDHVVQILEFVSVWRCEGLPADVVIHDHDL